MSVYLYSDLISRFNASFRKVWKRHKLERTNEAEADDAFVFPAFFNQATRTFRWIGFDADMWGDLDDIKGLEAKDKIRASRRERIQGLLNYLISTQPEALRDFLARQPSLSAYAQAGEVMKAAIRHRNECDVVDETMADACLYHFQLLYSGTHHKSDKNIEGFYYQKFEEAGSESRGFDEWEATLEKKDETRRFFTHINSQKLVDETGLEIPEHLYGCFVTPHSLATPAKNKETVAVIIPLYDVYIDNIGYGGLKAIFAVFFGHDTNARNTMEAWLERYREAKADFEEIAWELAEASGIIAVTEPIERGHDLLRHFLWALRRIQDWESATVYFEGKEQYAFKKIKPGESKITTSLGDSAVKWTWEEESPATSFAQYEPHDGIKKTDGGQKYFMWWTSAYDVECHSRQSNLWDQKFIPNLGAEDAGMFGRYSIRFEFPKAAKLPRGDDDQLMRQLRLTYLRQQLDLMRVLIPKVQTRRKALRTAVSAIMGRNMSHNLGSHVLSRYSSNIYDDLQPTPKEGQDHRRDFLNYLQKRMDFLAEVATSSSSFWEQALPLVETLRLLNYRDQVDGLQGIKSVEEQNDTKKGNRPVLLHYISGKESLQATVVLEKTCVSTLAKGDAANLDFNPEGVELPWFSCPSGEVGLHALYVILENIIRNSARHGNGADGVVLHIMANRAEDDWIKLRVIDPRSAVYVHSNKVLDTEGWVLDSNNKPDKSSPKNRDMCHQINHIIDNESLLDDEGKTNPNYWGLREMHLCAHYLRGLSFDDIDNPLPEGEKDKPVLAAEPWPAQEGDNYLSYVLYLKTAKRLAILTSSEDKTLQNENQHPWGNLGIRGIEFNPQNPEWRKVAAQAKGYEFLAVDEGQWKSLEVESADIRSVLPVRVVTLNASDRAGIMGQLSAEDWMQPLHEIMMRRYQCGEVSGGGRAILWGGKQVKLAVAWDSKNNEAIGAASIDGDAAKPFKSCSHEKLENGVYKPFGSSDGFPTGDKYVALAWVDHAKNENMNPDYDGARLEDAYLQHTPFMNWASAEPIWSQSLHHQILRISHTSNGVKGLTELAAAAFARVVILDERVQSRRHDKVREMTMYKYWPQAGIWSPLHPKDFEIGSRQAIDPKKAFHEPDFECDLDNPDFEKLRNFLDNPTKATSQTPADFVVVHLTLLERLRKKRPEDLSLNDTLRGLLNGTQCQNAHRIMVTGRGVPSGQAELEARFLPISALLEFLSVRPSKLGLMRVLWASTGRPVPSSY